MAERSSDPDQSATPVDIATLYSRANVQATRYWDFSASRKQVRGQFCHQVSREPAEPAAAAAPPQFEDHIQVPEFEDQIQAPQVEPPEAGEEARALEADLPAETQEMADSGAAAEQPSAAPTLENGPERSEESRPAPVMQWPVPRQSAGYALAAGNEALPPARDGKGSRWYALQSVFAPVKGEVGALGSLEQRPPVVAVFSLAGGVGKTCLVATLGRALSALGERVLLADNAAYGLLPFYFGSRESKPQSQGQGLVRTFSPPGFPLAGADSDAPVHLLSLEAERFPEDGEEHDPLLEELVREGRGLNRILVDVATAGRDLTRRLLSLRPMILVPILPDMSSVASLGALEAFLAGAAKPDSPDGASTEPLYLLNQFDASSPLHLDVRELLRQQLGDRLLPFVLRRSSAVSEALAEGMTVIDYAPGSAAAEDYWNLAGWLRSLAAPAAVGFGGVRWTER